MHFVDEVRIFVKAGNGGNGCISFLREKYRPRGGPNGGNGGRGGSVICQVDPQLSTLLNLRYTQHIRAVHGEHGRGKDQHGRAARDRVVRVPPGTLIRDLDSGEVLADLTRPDRPVVVARGGQGGKGNAFFASARNRLPRQAQPGQAGEERTLRLELRVLADVGLVGFPNVGKSTLLSSVSAARPRIADFPFTTLTPHLGVVRYGDDGAFVMADIPGLIEGAHKGHGLGTRFLRHLSRASVLVCLLDISDPQRDPWHDYGVLTHELRSFDPALLGRPRLVAVTKYDLPIAQERFAEVAATFASHDIGLMTLSAVSRKGLSDLLWNIDRALADARKLAEEAAAGPGASAQSDEEAQAWD